MSATYQHAETRPELYVLAGLRGEIHVESFRDERRRRNTYRVGAFTSTKDTKEAGLKENRNETMTEYLQREIRLVRRLAKKRHRAPEWQHKLPA